MTRRDFIPTLAGLLSLPKIINEQEQKQVPQVEVVHGNVKAADFARFLNASVPRYDAAIIQDIYDRRT